MRSILILLALASSAFAQHFPEHVPDFSDDTKAVYVRAGETLEIDGLKCVSTLVVEHGGTLILWPGADIVVLDQPFHPADTAEIGNGIIVMGDVLCMGSPKTPFVRSVSGIPAGATSATFATPPQGWLPGDRLVIPDTRQRVNPSDYDSHTETVTITQVCGGTVEFTPTQYDHPVGTHEWMTPHVANLTRDVLIRSENPDGIRGHIMVMGGTGEWGYAEIRDMGRTDATRLIGDDNTNGRYPWHLHLMGDGGANQHAEGLAIVGSRKWCATIHGTSNATMVDCIGVGAVGATFVTENGLERNNAFHRCLAVGARSGIRPGEIVRLDGDTRDFAREASGFWSRLAGNHFIDCIAANVGSKGFVIDGQHLPSSFRYPRATDGGIHRGNETYATGTALWIREHVGGVDRAIQSLSPRVNVESSVGWSLSASGAFIYRTTNVHISDCHWYADPVVSARNRGEPDPHSQNRRFLYTSKGFAFTEGYPVSSCSVTNSSCEGFNIGVFLPPAQFAQLDYGAVPGFTMTDVHLSAAIPICVPVVKNDAPYMLTGITWDRDPDVRIQPQPPDTDIWLNTGGKIIEWPRPSEYRIWINGERYYYPDEPGDNRASREGVIGLVETSN